MIMFSHRCMVVRRRAVETDSDIQTEPTQIEEMKAAADAAEIVEIIAEAELALDLYAPQSMIQRAIEMKVAN